MVRVSTTAVDLLEENRRNQGIPGSHGVRIFGEENEQGGMDVRLVFTDDPEEHDARLEEHGTRFFVAAEMIRPLEGTLIDVEESAPQRLTVRRDEATD